MHQLKNRLARTMRGGTRGKDSFLPMSVDSVTLYSQGDDPHPTIAAFPCFR